MAREQIITALDIGSATVRVASALVDKKEGGLRLVGAGSRPTLGVRRGQIVDIPEVVKSTEEAFSEAERTSGFSISRAVVSVSGPQVELLRSVGSVAVSRADGEVSPEDVERVLSSARTVSLPKNKEVVHTIPVSYTLDNEEGLQDPIGMQGVRLEANVVLVLASTPLLRTISKVVSEAGRQGEQWVFGSRGAGRAVLTKKQKEAGVALCNIGGTTTDIAVFKEGEVVDYTVVPVGGGHITHDVAIGLKTAIDVAERIKVEYGNCFASGVSKREKVVLTDWGLEDISISRYALSKIIEGRVRSLFSKVADELSSYIDDNALPGGVVLVGGGAKLDGIVECAKRDLKLPASLPQPIADITGELPALLDPAYAPVLGALLVTYEQQEGEEGALPAALETHGLLERAKDFFKEFMP